jgi:hypothetical protein
MSEPNEETYIFMCGVNWQEEMQHPTDMKVATTEEELKRISPCCQQCGIVRLRVSDPVWIVEQDFSVEIPKTDKNGEVNE